MRRAAIAAVSLVLLSGPAVSVASEAPKFAPCENPPAAVLALGTESEIELYAVGSESIAVAALTGDGNPGGSLLRVATPGRTPKDVKLDGRVMGLAVAPDGTAAFAIVRASTRKGEVRSVRLERIDLATARVTDGPTIPLTARGLAIGEGGSTLLIASRDEIRTFQLPGLSSGPLYRALGDNVGVAPIPGSTVVLLAQRSRVVLADLAGSQGREGLALSQEVAAPAPLRGMLASTGNAGPIALSDGRRAWCVSGFAPPPKSSPPPPAPPPEASEPSSAPEAAPEPETIVAAASGPKVSPAPPSAAASSTTRGTEPSPVVLGLKGSTEPGTVFGRVEGPAVAEVGAILFLGPDNVLREAARTAPSGMGDFVSSALDPGAYRVVAAGKGGRVLICEPAFITIRVDSKGAVELPVLKVLRAQ